MKWKKVKLTEICKPKQWKNLPISELTDEGYPVYGANGIIGRYNVYNHEHPTLAITCRGATCGTINVTKPKSYITSNAMALNELSDAVDQMFLYYALNKRGFKDVITGAAQPQITREGLSKIILDIPERKEDQLHIANLLRKAENLIAQRKESIRMLDEFLKSTFLEMFGDPLINSKQWRIIKIKDCGKIVTGTTPPSSKDGMFGGEIPFITPSDLESDEPYRRFVTKLGAENSRTVRKGATFICCIGSIGKVQRAKVLSAFNQQLNAIEWNNDFNDLFGERLMRFMKPRVIAKGGGSTTLPILNKGDFEKLEIIHPPIELQTQFAHIVEKTEALKTQYQQSLQELENLYGSLSQKAFRGELELSKPITT